MLLTPADVSAIDAEMVHAHGIDTFMLMEQASEAAHSALLTIIDDQYRHARSICVVCGNGNNGGDGLCLARMLSKRFNVSVIWSGSAETLSQAARYNLARLPDAIVLLTPAQAEHLRADIVIDAVLGVGGRLPLRQTAIELIKAVNAMQAPVIAIDLPSGLDAQTGECSGYTKPAAHTITMQARKVGMLLGKGPEVCGTIHAVDIGVPFTMLTTRCNNHVLSEREVASRFRPRLNHTSKFDYGRLVVIGGTRSMPGAPSLTAHAAIAIGAGIVDLAAPAIHPLTPREIMTHALPSNANGNIDTSAEDVLAHMLSRVTAVAVGPGLGSNEQTIEMIARLLCRLDSSVPIVLDADGLRCLPHLPHGRSIVITPHMGEFARILQTDRSMIEHTYVERAQNYARKHSIVVHVKNVPSITTDGRQSTFLSRGTPAMATAGSGDVLTGLIAGLLAQKLPLFEAARCGAWLHAAGGEHLVQTTGRRSLMAHELIGASREVLAAITGQNLPDQ